MNGESANKFISALVKSLQTLCHGYVEFNDGIEIIGHLYLNIDSGSSFDYVVKEKVCKNAENSTVFVSKSFQAQAPAEECITRKDRDDDPASVFEDSSNMSPTTGTTRLQSAITSISNVLAGASQESHKSRLLDHSSHHPSPQNTGKRKREHNGNYSSMQPPYKYTTLQTSSSSSSSYFSSGPPSKQAADRNHSEHFSNQSHAEFFGGDSNQSSGMGPDDDDDLDLDVTFVKEEFESQRNSSQRGVSAGAASRLSQDPSSSQSNMLHDGTPGSGSLGYPAHHQAPQQFATGSAGDIGSINQSFQDSSQVDVGQHSAQGPPNPRSEASPPSSHLDVEPDLSSSQPLKLDGITGMSDTMQLGIKLFGAKFVADMASGELDLPPAPSDVLRINETDTSESANASVFPDMFDLTAVSTSSLKPSHKLLWHDRKDKMRRCTMTRKANLAKFRNKGSSIKASDSETTGQEDLSKKPIKKLLDNNASLDSFGMPYRRKRGRPPKRLKCLSDGEYPAINIDQMDQLLGGSVRDFGKTGSETTQGKELGMIKSNPIRTQSSLHEVAPIRPVAGCEGYSRRIRGSYRQYSAADKLEIVDFGIKYGSTAASRKYSIPESTVRSWTKKMDTFLIQMNVCNPSSLDKQPQLSLVHKKEDDFCHAADPQSPSLKQDNTEDNCHDLTSLKTIKNLPLALSTVE